MKSVQIAKIMFVYRRRETHSWRARSCPLLPRKANMLLLLEQQQQCIIATATTYEPKIYNFSAIFAVIVVVVIITIIIVVKDVRKFRVFQCRVYLMR